MKQASIDLGTNTCLLLVKDALPSGERILHDESTIVRLGQGVDQAGELNPEAMKRAYDCLSRYANIVKNLGLEPSAILAVGTAQARDARNAADFFQKIKTELGIQFRVLSGDEEAKATFLGAALPGMSPQEMVVMDIGGGSTELVTETVGKSLQIGAVRMTERFLKSDPVTDEEFWKCEDAIDHALEEMVPLIQAWREKNSANQSSKQAQPQFVAVAGTAVTLAMLQLASPQYHQKEIDGFQISKGDAHRIVEELKWRSVAERKQMVGMEPKRADVILAGALIFWRVMEKFNFADATISTRGLRYGVFKI
jgi:exopolyphosphatase/guanosine-5'-triphosphate,3'-diphosphate pyrophosphatase